MIVKIGLIEEVGGNDGDGDCSRGVKSCLCDFRTIKNRLRRMNM